MVLCDVCLNLEYGRIQKTDDATEKVLGRVVLTTLLDLERSAGQGCHTCTILRDGIKLVGRESYPSLNKASLKNPKIVIRLRRGHSLELRIGDVVDCDTIEYYSHFGSDPLSSLRMIADFDRPTYTLGCIRDCKRCAWTTGHGKVS
jgi:hypothetical protein